ncbi:MAG: YqgE/AlgH family protein [Myxococcota bacterium]|nr:YqgE/AlgH family protein [Myxococcota bacterium]
MSDELAPGLLISMPDLLDPNFYRSVVLMCAHSSEGAFGLKINHPLELTTAQVCSEVQIAWHGDEEQAAFSGGPVEPSRGWLLHGDDTMYVGSQRIARGIAMSPSHEALEAYGRSPAGAFRLVLGYAEWGPGQLEQELEQGSWITAPVSHALLFATAPEDAWSKALRSIGIDPLHLVGGGSAVN